VIRGTNLIFRFISISLVALLSSCESSVTTSPWELVDSNSILIFESSVVPILPDEKYNSYFISNANVYLTAVQKLAKNDFDIIYSYALSRDKYDSLFKQSSLKKDVKGSTRQFNGFEIHEVKNDKNEIELIFAYVDGVLTLSKSSILIENAIRVFQNKEKINFRNNNSELFQFPLLKSDAGDVYINTNRISEIFHEDILLIKSIPILTELKNKSIYDVKSGKDFMSLNGFSLGLNSGMSLFQKQKPVTFNVARYVPNQSTSLVHFGISDFDELGNVIDSMLLKNINVGREIAFISTSKSLLGLVSCNSASLEGLTFITEYNELYYSQEIRSVNGEELKRIFGKLFPVKPFNFCTIKDGYLMLSYSIDDIKLLIDAIESDNTWGKTIEYQKFSERGLQESNVSVILKKPDLFSASSGLLKSYSRIIDSLQLSKVNWYSIQMSALDNHFYSTINLSLGRSEMEPNELNRKIKSSSIELSGEVTYASLVKNHNTGQQEVFIQDSDFWVYLFSSKEGVIWKRQIGGRINGSLEQLDFYKNGKLQYFFSSNNKLYLIDRLGRDVPGFPKILNSSIRVSGVVDYDKSKNYRFLVALAGNDVYLLDKDGKNLNEWGPKKFDKEIIYRPEHFKVAGKDYFIVFLADGSVNIFNRRGDRTGSFTIKSKNLISGDYFIESGMSFSETYLYYLSKDGVVTKQSLDGKVISSDNLPRGKGSSFVLKRIFNLEGYYIYRVDADKIVVFDKQSTVVLEKPNYGSTQFDFQCVNVENGKKLFSLFDGEQNLVMIMDELGNNLIQTPIESDILPLFNLGKQNSEMGVYSFPKKSVVYTLIK